MVACEFLISRSAGPSGRAQSIIQTQNLPGLHKERPGMVRLAQGGSLLLMRCAQTTLTSNKIYNPAHPRKDGTLFASGWNMTTQARFPSHCEGCPQAAVGTLLCAQSLFLSTSLPAEEHSLLFSQPHLFIPLPPGI